MCRYCGRDCTRPTLQHPGAVYPRERATLFNPQALPRPHLDATAASHQHQPPSVWQHRVVGHHQSQHLIPTSYATATHYNIAMHQQAGGDLASWMATRDRERGAHHAAPAFQQQPRFNQTHAAQHSVYGQSFFEDCLQYRPEEATLYNPLEDFLPQQSNSHPTDFLTMPYAPVDFPSPANNTTTGQAVPASDDVPIMPLVQTNVDTAQFEVVQPKDWHKASLDLSFDDDEFATSPGSSNDTSMGPYTPHDDSNNFVDVSLRRLSTNDLSSSFESNGASMFGDLSCNVSFSSASDLNSSVGSQFGSQSSHFAGLPFSGSRVSKDVQALDAIEELPLNQGAFRGIDGLPAAAPSPEEPDVAGATRATNKSKRRRPSERESETDAISRDEKDQYLLDRREEGYTYKEIKVMGHFAEAESTLRGRVRVLTKDRSERVRKPVWTERDIRLLRRGVGRANRLRAEGAYNRSRSSKLPWKHIASYIGDHGGSYGFAPATCAKKWEEVSRTE